MNVDHWLSESIIKLEKAGVLSARLDCLILLEDFTQKNRSWLIAHPELQLNKSLIQNLDRLIARRLKHEPLAYMRGKTEFYGREFYVNKHVLVPRPETETIIDLFRDLLGNNSLVSKGNPWKVVDVGTGSGALAITVKLEMPEAEVIATDIDPNCLEVARKNAVKHGAKIKFLQGNLLQPHSNLQPVTCNLVLANLPYVPEKFTINQAATHEPKLAIYGGKDGLGLYRRLFDQIKRLKTPPKYILTESLPLQHQQLAKIAQSAHYQLQKSADFIQLFELVLT